MRWWFPKGESDELRLLRYIASIQEKIMAQLDDLRASLQASNDKITEVAGKVDAVQADVQNLIDRLGTVEPPIPDDILASARSIEQRLGSVSDDLDTTPKAPPA